MTDRAVAVPAEFLDDLRWLRTACATAFCSLSLILIAVIVMAFLEAELRD
jgi:hypothetical protein